MGLGLSGFRARSAIWGCSRLYSAETLSQQGQTEFLGPCSASQHQAVSTRARPGAGLRSQVHSFLRPLQVVCASGWSWRGCQGQDVEDSTSCIEEFGLDPEQVQS